MVTKIFKNHYPLSVGNQILNSSEINYIQELKPALKQFLKHNKKYHYSCLKIADFQHNIILNVNFNAFQIIVRLIDDELIEYNTECHIDNDKIKYMKFITARYNNHDFDNNLASLINSDINIKDLFFRIILETPLEHVPSGSEYAHILEFFNITNSVNVVDALDPSLYNNR